MWFWYFRGRWSCKYTIKLRIKLHPVSNRFKYHFMMNIPQALNLHKRLELDHGRMTLIQVREWDKLKRLSARFRNHLHFTLHCKHRNVTPVSLRVKTCVKGEAANNIIHRTQRALLNVRIKEINFKIRTFNGLIADKNEELFTSLPSDMHTEVTNCVTHAHKAEWEKCRARQQNKFARLISSHAPTADRTRRGPHSHTDSGRGRTGDQGHQRQVGD